MLRRPMSESWSVVAVTHSGPHPELEHAQRLGRAVLAAAHRDDAVVVRAALVAVAVEHLDQLGAPGIPVDRGAALEVAARAAHAVLVEEDVGLGLRVEAPAAVDDRAGRRVAGHARIDRGRHVLSIGTSTARRRSTNSPSACSAPKPAPRNRRSDAALSRCTRATTSRDQRPPPHLVEHGHEERAPVPRTARSRVHGDADLAGRRGVDVEADVADPGARHLTDPQRRRRVREPAREPHGVVGRVDRRPRPAVADRVGVVAALEHERGVVRGRGPQHEWLMAHRAPPLRSGITRGTLRTRSR